jgi:hypothetical protein
MEVNVRAEGFHLRFYVEGYESERRGKDSYDDNWLSGTVTLELARAPTATFRAQCRTSWQTVEFAGFQEALRTLLVDLTGTATFSTTEDQVELTIRLKGGKGTIEGRVEEHAMARTEFEAEIDQSFLGSTLAELRAVTAKYPFRR